MDFFFKYTQENIIYYKFSFIHKMKMEDRKWLLPTYEIRIDKSH